MATRPANRSFKSPKGTRDLYPEDVLRRRYLVQAWRDTSIRHGFEEIEGPTFEEAELYAVKSGEGILGELFQAFSGKSPEEVVRVRETGRAPFAMRPEFTPTLARMYAARAKQLNKPTRWFQAGPFFRAERPQRGRLREFWQWNCDVIGDAAAGADAGVMGVAAGLLDAVGLHPDSCSICYSNRQRIERLLDSVGVEGDAQQPWLAAIDKAPKLSFVEVVRSLRQLDPDGGKAATMLGFLARAGVVSIPRAGESTAPISDEQMDKVVDSGREAARQWHAQHGVYADAIENYLDAALAGAGLEPWCRRDYSIVRGLAYYTGTVFEVIADGERAVAGGGRYDRLIELLGGPPTPAVGFAMGDVVLGLLLEDKGVMPEGPGLMDALSRPPASARPEAFVIGANDEASDPLVRRLVGDLRRGIETEAYRGRDDRKPWRADRYSSGADGPACGGVRPMHARSSDKSTRNLKKLLNDAERQFARFAVIIHGDESSPDRVQVKDMDARKDLTPADIPGLTGDKPEFSVDPASPVYVGRALAAITT